MKKILNIIILLVAVLTGFFAVRLIMPQEAGKLSKKINLYWEKILFALEEGVRESRVKESELKRKIRNQES